MMERQETNPDMTALHFRRLGAGPPTAMIAAIQRLLSPLADVVKRRSSAPPVPADRYADADEPSHPTPEDLDG